MRVKDLVSWRDIARLDRARLRRRETEAIISTPGKMFYYHEPVKEGRVNTKKHTIDDEQIETVEAVGKANESIEELKLEDLMAESTRKWEKLK